MHCKHCGFANGEDDHRCLRCGRRVAGVVIAAPPGYSGANALAVATLTEEDSKELTLDTQTGMPAQAAMFTLASPKVIPFDRVQRQVAARTQCPPHAQQQVRQKDPSRGQRPAQDKAARSTAEQTTLDFIPAAPAKNRKLKTNVDAQVFCDSPVATPTHRSVAAAIDAAFIAIGFGLIVVVFLALGGSFGAGRMFWTGLGGTLALVAALYGLMWAIAGTETAGMRFTDLQLITFDGFPLDGRSRALRFASSWLSFCSGGLGLIWAVADEENLTWHDHISKTFPTVKEAPRSFVKQRR